LLGSLIYLKAFAHLNELRFCTHGQYAIVFYYPKRNAAVAASIPCTESIVLRVNYGADRFKVELTKAAIARPKIFFGKMRKLSSEQRPVHYKSSISFDVNGVVTVVVNAVAIERECREPE
jgi:hypothetical protein